MQNSMHHVGTNCTLWHSKHQGIGLISLNCLPGEPKTKNDQEVQIIEGSKNWDFAVCVHVCLSQPDRKSTSSVDAYSRQ